LSLAPGAPSTPAADLEAEREFYLRSLRDLEAEHSAGDIDDLDYQALRDDYTTRAAGVLRRLEGLRAPAAAGDSQESPADVPGRRSLTSEGQSGGQPGGKRRGRGGRHQEPAPAATQEPAPAATRAAGTRRPWTRTQKALLAAAALALAAGAGWQVGQGSSSRLNGQTITGQTLDAQAVTELLVQGEQSAAKHPVAALQDFNRILAAYPDQPQALTDEGWVLAQGGLLPQARAYLQHAERSDPGYALPHAYLGIVLGDQGDYRGAVTQLQYFLAHHPEPALESQARAALSVAQRDLKASSPKSGG
jgi:tetratricopeptide (TPR) repeat protein